RYMEERYLVRRDAVTSSAGDAVASNSAIQIPTPWPRGSHDTNIAFDGEKIGGAVKAYKADMEYLREQPNQLTDTPNIGRGSSAGAGAAPAAGPPSGQGYGTGAAPGP
ncbi:MAG: hypothetical protein ACREDA_09940, partial [Methylocella sp.]